MITLDGLQYSVFQTNYAHKETKIASASRSITNKVLRTESGAAQSEYDLVLLCSVDNIQTLRTSFRKTTPLVFTDEEGVTWSPLSGYQDETHYYLTGVYFDVMGEPKPMTPRGWVGNTYTVTIHLLTKAYRIAPRISGQMLSQSGDFLLTEAGDRILWQM